MTNCGPCWGAIGGAASLKERAHGAHQAASDHRYSGITALAEGGPVTPNAPHIVGERGPELFVPSQSGTVVPNVNLGNIRDRAGGFRHFRDAFEAAHAIIGTVSRYRERFGASTIASILKHYSPPNENQTSTLIKNMMRRTGIGPRENLDFGNLETAAKFAYGIAVQEGKAREGSLDQFRRLFSHEGNREHLRSGFGHPRQDRNIMASARQANLPGAQAHTIEGNAGIMADFKNMPRGIRPMASATGIFKEVKLNRGRAGAFASQEG